MLSYDTKSPTLTNFGIKDARVDRNGDWSGNAYIVWADDEGHHEVRVPGMLLKVLCKAKSKKTGRIRIKKSSRTKRSTKKASKKARKSRSK